MVFYFSLRSDDRMSAEWLKAQDRREATQGDHGIWLPWNWTKFVQDRRRQAAAEQSRAKERQTRNL